MLKNNKLVAVYDWPLGWHSTTVGRLPLICRQTIKYQYIDDAQCWSSHR